MTVLYQWQMYWPNWWKIWPFYATILDKDFNQKVHYAGFGPFQCRWRTHTHTQERPREQTTKDEAPIP